MDNTRYQDDLRELRARIRGHRLAMGVLALCLLVTLMITYSLVGAQRVVVTPPQVTKSFWVSGERVGNAYLEQMGGYVAWLMLDLTPASAGWKKDALLSFSSPEDYEALKLQMELEAERLRKINGSTYFQLQQLEPDEEAQTVLLTGRLRTLVNGLETSLLQKRYRVAFQFRGGRTHLKTFKEIGNE
ncbi:type IV conjugative transfer system protein TraE [Pseudoduganella namucuonensis]|uniref:Conjugal transfer pilus assembly protein TraE n=1 Tax=Pseudoduganella namucuonensis TaxID=1035707 RepID=A0A1I7M482_9BURK|nr:type IV conjugative transfer system protein TraE [Pseudoduganella namucuonensis]SFV16734.1 conjugal transfer pilus assembly protein TraE [Pseudoduganella namucuonensis]